jgi:hypothetical protein
MSDSSIRLPSHDALTAALQDQLGYSKAEAEAVWNELTAARAEVRKAFQNWWEQGRLDTLEVEGWTAQRIAEQMGCLPPAAILHLDWLLTDPTEALAAIQRGYDRILPKREELEEPGEPKEEG